MTFSSWQEGTYGSSFTACSFFTPSYRDKAQRLAASLEKLKISHALFEVPAVHHSISRHGTEDVRFSKPRFIAMCLEQMRRSILYIDCDMIVRNWPEAVDGAVRAGADLAVFNWLASNCNDAWCPLLPQSPVSPPRLWRFRFNVEAHCPEQLIASGPVQLWRQSPATTVLLRDWEAALNRFPRASDDHVLDFAHNRGGARSAGLRPSWLPADHARYAFWPYVKPVIDHPSLPSSLDGHFESLPDRFDRDRLQPCTWDPVLPRDLILEAHNGLLLRPDQKETFVPVAQMQLPLFLDDFTLS